MELGVCVCVCDPTPGFSSSILYCTFVPKAGTHLRKVPNLSKSLQFSFPLMFNCISTKSQSELDQFGQTTQHLLQSRNIIYAFQYNMTQFRHHFVIDKNIYVLTSFYFRFNEFIDINF